MYALLFDMESLINCSVNTSLRFPALETRYRELEVRWNVCGRSSRRSTPSKWRFLNDLVLLDPIDGIFLLRNSSVQFDSHQLPSIARFYRTARVMRALQWHVDIYSVE